MDTERLRAELTAYIRRKFYGRPNVADCAEDVVQTAFADVGEGLWNFGYLSKACLREGFKIYARQAREELIEPTVIDAAFCDAAVDDIARYDDAEAVLRSLDTLRAVERVVVRERYYGGFSFKEIAERHGLNLNTVLSQHRRALSKLRNELSADFCQNPAEKSHYGGNSNEREVY